ncbi:MAG: hypothetical protein IKU86_06230 [Thermoguttaceae bacterium]|nr:hypothetical protein [Thermoguttaceae bacterium]
MNKEERRVDRDAKTVRIYGLGLLPLPDEPEEAKRIVRLFRRQACRDYAWTWSDVNRCLGGSREELRSLGVKIGRRWCERGRVWSRVCVYPVPGYFNGLRPILVGLYHPDSRVASFGDAFLVPKRKAGKVVDRMLKASYYQNYKLPWTFRRCPPGVFFETDPLGQVRIR